MRCIHCLQELREKTKDHVFPKSWYTNDTPSWVQRWTVPSCRECNQKFGKLEQELFVKLVPCIDPYKLEASGITNKLIKTLEERPHFVKWIRNNLKPYSKDKKAFPGLGPHPGFPIEFQLYIPAPVDLLMSVLGKIFRGVEYIMGGEYIEHPYNLKIYHVEAEPKEIKDIFENWGKKEALGPGFKIERATPSDMKRPVIYKQTTWGTITSYASIFKNETLPETPL
jgi:hypothetical protein